MTTAGSGDEAAGFGAEDWGLEGKLASNGKEMEEEDGAERTDDDGEKENGAVSTGSGKVLFCSGI